MEQQQPQSSGSHKDDGTLVTTSSGHTTTVNTATDSLLATSTVTTTVSTTVTTAVTTTVTSTMASTVPVTSTSTISQVGPNGTTTAPMSPVEQAAKSEPLVANFDDERSLEDIDDNDPRLYDPNWQAELQPSNWRWKWRKVDWSKLRSTTPSVDQAKSGEPKAEDEMAKKSEEESDDLPSMETLDFADK